MERVRVFYLGQPVYSWSLDMDFSNPKYHGSSFCLPKICAEIQLTTTKKQAATRKGSIFFFTYPEDPGFPPLKIQV